MSVRTEQINDGKENEIIITLLSLLRKEHT